MVESRSFMPDVFFRPDHLLIQINAFLYRVIALINNVPAENIHDIGLGTFYLTARIVTGIFAMGSVIAAYLIGRRYCPAVGLTGAFLFAVFPLFTTHSKYATPDVPTTFFMLMFVFFALKYMEKPAVKYLALTSLVTAAFIAVKYPGAILCAMIAISVIVCGVADKRPLRILTHGIAAAVFTLVFVFLISPVLFLRFGDVRAAIVNEARSAHPGADGLGMGGNMLFYLNTFITAGGIILLVFFVIGCVSLLSGKRGFYKHLPLFYSFIYFIGLSYLPLHWERWALPMYVGPLLISAIGIHKVYELIKTGKMAEKRQKIAIAAFAAVFGLSAANMGTAAFANQLAFRLPDTRVVSQPWAAENGVFADNTVYEGYTTLNPADPGDASWLFEEIDGIYRLKYSRVRYIIVSSMMFDRYRNEPDRYAGQNAFYDSLVANFKEKKRFDVACRNTSPLDPVNIKNSISYIKRASAHGMAGPTLIFYEALAHNYSPYILSTPINFAGGDKYYERYYVKGLAEQEESGVRTDGGETRFLFYLMDPGSDLYLSFTVTPFLGGGIKAQRVEILANGEPVGTIEIKEKGTYGVTVPEGIAGDMLDLQFLLHDAAASEGAALLFHDMQIAPR